MFCNGVSSSPSNTESNYSGPNFPLITIFDNVCAQKKLLNDVFDINEIKISHRMVHGWSTSLSMGFLFSRYG